MLKRGWMRWAAAVLSAGLLELPFPLAGPMPPWRSIFAWFGLAPLIWAVLRMSEDAERPLRRSFLVAYLCGFLWYMGNCYWVRDTMARYGDMPAIAPVLLLIAFSLVLGLYFGLFGLGIAVLRRRFGLTWALAAAPFLWVALELAAARITSVPWYSQVDNGLAIALGPWTGAYGVSFVLVAANAALVGLIAVRNQRQSRVSQSLLSVECAVAFLGSLLASGVGTKLLNPSRVTTTATAVLVQPNLDVAADNSWEGAEWDKNIAQFAHLASEQCKTYIAGIPQTGASSGEIICPPYPTHPDLVAWPESPAPFAQVDPAFQRMAAKIAQQQSAPLVVGGVGMDYSEPEQRWMQFNSAMVVGPDGRKVGRYDKIHLVPFGEFVPFQKLLFFAKKLTGRVSRFDRGTDHSVFRIQDQHGAMRRYGIFICYEAVFADEVRELAKNGAEVLVNISDDAWYGDTSAPWQHLNMARMRAIENRRWLLRDTNNGVTAAIDPYGRVRQSIPRHAVDALPAQFGFRDDVTFYTQHGDVFAWLCAIAAAGAVLWSLNGRVSRSAS
jgi:apolipoprotein N-acyltransferase